MSIGLIIGIKPGYGIHKAIDEWIKSIVDCDKSITSHDFLPQRALKEAISKILKESITIVLQNSKEVIMNDNDLDNSNCVHKSILSDIIQQGYIAFNCEEFRYSAGDIYSIVEYMDEHINYKSDNVIIKCVDVEV